MNGNVPGDVAVRAVFNSYAANLRQQLLTLRAMILDVAVSIPSVGPLEETLKWGEPSYLSTNGSTIRIDWKSRSPEQYAIYFKCTSRLVETFKTIFKNTFGYEGKRAIVFKLDDEIPKEELKKCLKAALSYHKVKHLPNLGIV